MEWILDIRHPALNPLFLGLSFLGDTAFFLAFAAVGYWLLHRRIFTSFAFVLMPTVLASAAAKALFREPRPDPALWLTHAEGWGFPSGHATVAAVVWPWLAIELRRYAAEKTDGPGGALPRLAAAAPWLAVALAFGVATSRVYLGVHGVRDVVAGLAFGGVILLLALRAAPALEAVLGSLGPVGLTLRVATVVGLVLSVLPPDDPVAAVAGGALVGFCFGHALERRRLGFVEPRGGPRPWLAAVLGLAGAFALRFGAKAPLLAILPSPAVADFARYALIGLWIGAAAPWLFVKLGWADAGRGTEAPEAA
ncbi:MAG: phosphatase PAP2 family protein [Acidobacteriota bacterium]